MMMRLILCLLRILFLRWVSLTKHYWIILRERRSQCEFSFGLDGNAVP